MKYLSSIIFLLVVSLSAMAQGIHFEHSTFNEALKKAKSENKVLFIDGYAVWCGPCKQMAKTVFMDKEVGDYFDKNIVALKVDVERGEGPMIKRNYGITGLPGYVFIDGDGHVTYRFSAAMPKEKFLEKVELAVAYSKDSNSVGRLAERYRTEKNDEQFVRLYLNKLKESKSTNYTEILEQYLNIQTSVPENSKEMVQLLADHNEEIVFGSKADEIIQRNNGSDAWKLYVRKDIREIFQKLPRKMLENTTDYAIAQKDTAILEMVMDRAIEAGVKVDDNQRKRTYVFYYLNTGNGEQYKKLVREDNEAYIQSINIQNLRDTYLKIQKEKAEGDPSALGTSPHSVRYSRYIVSMVNNYAKFAETEQEKEDVIRWMKVGYDIIPGDAITISAYANVLYFLGKDKNKAIELKEEAYQIISKEEGKAGAAIKADLELMKAGEPIVLN